MNPRRILGIIRRILGIINSELICVFYMVRILFLTMFKKIGTPSNGKSVFFIGNCYNAFYTLACGLEKRGWKVCSLNPYPLDQFVQDYHVSVDLGDYREAIKVFFDILFNYKVLHVYNRTIQSIYAGPGTLYIARAILRVEILKIFKKIIIFTPSGCLDGSTAKEIYTISNGVCNKCIWQNNLAVCNDLTNQKKVDWIIKNCNMFSNEVDLPKSLAKSRIGCVAPLSPIDSTIYNLDLHIPDNYRLPKNDGELIIFTAFGNQKIRTNDTKDIKGKKYILLAIDRLIAEGLPIKHLHASEIPAKDMKYLQAQADIIVDQLNYGTIGSSAREGMMLGKTVICHISDEMRSCNVAMKDCPAVDATEETIYFVLKDLVLSLPTIRADIGSKSREWMIKWFDADVCARRYERIFNHLKNKSDTFIPPLEDPLYQ